MNFMLCNTVDEVKSYYCGKYRTILSGLKDMNAYNFEIDKSCGSYLELKFSVNGKRAKVNIGINNKFNTWVYPDYVTVRETKRNKFATQREAVEYFERNL